MTSSASNSKGFDDETKSNYWNSDSPSLHFTPKNVYSTKNNFMCGICVLPWLKILYTFGRFVEFQYYPRVLFVGILSIVNSALAFVETVLYSNAISRVELPDDPVFILGHPRTGTTLIHNLLDSDPDNFFGCTTFCAGFPSSFLWFEKWGKVLFASVIEKTRPMDSMPLHFDLPQEDEVATNVLSGGCSYYMPLCFMQQELQFRRYFDFSKADGATDGDEAEWTNSFLYLMKKLCLRSQLRNTDDVARKRLLIKSPVHTARVPLLRKLFPKARFIYVHRHPDEVLASAAHMADTAYWFAYLNTPTDEQVTEFILWQFEHMWSKYNNAVSVGDGEGLRRRVCEDILEVSYANVVNHPVNTLEVMYAHVGCEWTSKQQLHFTRETALLKSYKPNHLPSHEPLKQLLRRRWSGYFGAFSYS